LNYEADRTLSHPPFDVDAVCKREVKRTIVADT